MISADVDSIQIAFNENSLTLLKIVIGAILFERTMDGQVSGKPTPQALIDKILAARTFYQGGATIEYTSSALVDLVLHMQADPAGLDAAARKGLGFNDSALHWDLVNTENKRVSAALRNGKSVCVYEKGMFRI